MTEKTFTQSRRKDVTNSNKLNNAMFKTCIEKTL